MRVQKELARAFYEIEAARESWSVATRAHVLRDVGSCSLLRL